MDSSTAASLKALPSQRKALPQVRSGRPGLAGILAAATIVTGLLGLWLLGTSVWEPESLLFALLLVGVICHLTAFQARRRLYVSLTDAPVLCALVLLGPFPALVVYVTNVILDFVLTPYRTVALMSNLATATGAVFVATMFAQVVGVTTGSEAGLAWPEYLLVLVTGLVLVATDLALDTNLIRISDGFSSGDLLDVHLRSSPGVLIALVVATLSIALYFEIGALGIILQIPALLGISIVAPRIMRRLSGVRLQHARPIESHAAAIADVMELGKRQKRLLRNAARSIRQAGPPTELDEFGHAMNVVLYSNERWDGHDSFPGVVSGDLIPIESRILAVATAWADLMAAQQCPPEVAASALGAQAGTYLDPTVVAAAKRAASLGAVDGEPELWARSGKPNDRTVA